MRKAPGGVRIHVDVRQSERVGPLLCVRDNGSGMDRIAMHGMMSFGVSSEGGQRIGRYGNGFKSSSMRIGSDALVLSVCRETGHLSAGLLSYTFLRSEQLEDVEVALRWGFNKERYCLRE